MEVVFHLCIHTELNKIKVLYSNRQRTRRRRIGNREKKIPFENLEIVGNMNLLGKSNLHSRTAALQCFQESITIDSKEIIHPQG